MPNGSNESGQSDDGPRANLTHNSLEDDVKSVDSQNETAPARQSNSMSPTKQKLRTTRVPNKVIFLPVFIQMHSIIIVVNLSNYLQACTICGQILKTYVVACDHYNRIHGRNVLMCPYCGLYFLKNDLLNKHVLAQHGKDEICPEPVSVQPLYSFYSNVFLLTNKINTNLHI